MRILKRITSKLIWHPFRVAVVDDQKVWGGTELYVAALHLAKALEKASDRPHVGVMLPTSGVSQWRAP